MLRAEHCLIQGIGLFRKMDIDKSGLLELEEISCIFPSEARARKLHRQIDCDITADEWCDILRKLKRDAVTVSLPEHPADITEAKEAGSDPMLATHGLRDLYTVTEQPIAVDSASSVRSKPRMIVCFALPRMIMFIRVEQMSGQTDDQITKFLEKKGKTGEEISMAFEAAELSTNSVEFNRTVQLKFNKHARAKEMNLSLPEPPRIERQTSGEFVGQFICRSSSPIVVSPRSNNNHAEIEPVFKTPKERSLKRQVSASAEKGRESVKERVHQAIPSGVSVELRRHMSNGVTQFVDEFVSDQVESARRSADGPDLFSLQRQLSDGVLEVTQRLLGSEPHVDEMAVSENMNTMCMSGGVLGGLQAVFQPTIVDSASAHVLPLCGFNDQLPDEFHNIAGFVY